MFLHRFPRLAAPRVTVSKFTVRPVAVSGSATPGIPALPAGVSKLAASLVASRFMVFPVTAFSLAVLLVTASALAAPAQTQAGTLAQAGTPATVQTQTTAPVENFRQCLADLQQQARDAGLGERTVSEVLPTLKRQSRVLELDQQQPEFVQTLADYLKRRVSQQRVKRGRELYAEYRPFLDQLTRRYGVPGRYLVAFWGLETNYGSYLGKMPSLDSLATLACDPRRSTYFAGELLQALRVMERESLEPAAMTGSWAGAMGHTQFMPSSYLLHAVDGDGDGRSDLWHSERDALASAANFLHWLGWQQAERWGREVQLPDDFPYRLALQNEVRTVAEWGELGIRRANGAALPLADIPATVLLPTGREGPAFLIYANFRVVMQWNQSESYALAVGLLADRIVGAGGLYRSPPDHEPMDRAKVTRMQTLLVQAGHDVGSIDGLFGPATRLALSEFQHANGMVADGFPDPASLNRLESATR